MDRLTIPNVRIDEHTTRRSVIDVLAVREHAMEIYWRLAAYEDTGLTPEEIKAALPEDVVIKLAAQALRTEPDRLRELAEADRLVREMEWRSDKYINYTATREKACKGCTSRDGAEGCYSMEPCERLIAEIICAPAANVVPAKRALEGKALDSSAEYTEICALYHFCIDLGIKCTIERLYDGYAVRFPDGSDFAQHHGTYGGTEGAVEPAIGDAEFDYSAVGLNLAKALVKKYKGKLEGRKEADHA